MTCHALKPARASRKAATAALESAALPATPMASLTHVVARQSARLLGASDAATRSTAWGFAVATATPPPPVRLVPDAAVPDVADRPLAVAVWIGLDIIVADALHDDICLAVFSAPPVFSTAGDNCPPAATSTVISRPEATAVCTVAALRHILEKTCSPDTGCSAVRRGHRHAATRADRGTDVGAPGRRVVSCKGGGRGGRLQPAS